MLFLCYCRVSTDEQVLGYSLDAQQTMIKDWVSLKYPEAETSFYIEKGKSATDLNRPQLKNLLDKAKKEKAYAVVVLCLDRLTRDVEDLCWLMNFFQETRIKLLSVMNYVDLDSADGRGNLLYNGVSAMMESQKISERSIRGMKQAVLEGKYPFARCPIGYEKIDNKLYLSKNNDEVEAARYVFNSIANNNANFIFIQRQVREKYNIDIIPAMMIKMLSRDLYTGTMKYKDVSNNNFCDPIIDKDTFKKANQAYKRKRRNTNCAKYYFKNVVYCGDCNNELMNQTSGYGGHNKEVYSYYVCPKCKKIVSQLKLVEVLADDLQSLSYRYLNEKDIDEIDKSIETLKKQQNALVEKQMSDDAIDIDVFYKLFRDLEMKIEDLNTSKFSKGMNIKHYNHISDLGKKEITKKYIDMIIIRFEKKGFTADLVLK